MPFYLNKIRQAIEPERILEFKIQDGWGPLCSFLNKDIPEENFPHLNDAEALGEKLRRNKKQAFTSFIRGFKQMAIGTIMLTVIALIYQRRFFFLRSS
ncbi:unnamed protein product [Rotaria sp. Silwood2]|nr:unnamed protein product [Rotaria sp. Silwood2]CAF3064531.1 unnamed protein product [Rotaria sp. Silwood2]CAF3210685.1 unnamed protein product [Rotaria sp. Silwood2]CAF4415004.1 unnamed protein product [Rotaria sp. Silwood2]CAF4430706.1 unnamed protein product [Rotaria sp. Silwood2]